MPKIYILLPVHNRKKITRGFIECLKAQTFTNYHLVLIDDGSTDGTAEMVITGIPSVTVLQGAGNWWWAGSLQQGLNWLRNNSLGYDDIILFINDDSTIDEHFLEIGSTLLQTLPDTMLQARVYCQETGELLDDGMVYDAKRLQFHAPKLGEKINCLTTNGLFVRWQDLKRVGNFYPWLLPHYLSDYEFTVRAGRKGLALSVVPQLSLRWNKGTTGYHSFQQDSFRKFWRAYFSKKSAANPFYWTNFALIASPLRYFPLHMLRIWKTTCVMIIKVSIASLKTKLINRSF